MSVFYFWYRTSQAATQGPFHQNKLPKEVPVAYQTPVQPNQGPHFRVREWLKLLLFDYFSLCCQWTFQSPRVIKTSVVWLLLIMLSVNLYITFVTAPAPIVFDGLWFWDVKRVEWENPAPKNESQLKQYTRNQRKFQTSRDRSICHGHIRQIQWQTEERTKGSDCGP